MILLTNVTTSLTEEVVQVLNLSESIEDLRLEHVMDDNGLLSIIQRDVVVHLDDEPLYWVQLHPEPPRGLSVLQDIEDLDSSPVSSGLAKSPL
jgi:hypothetical protein